MKELKIQAYFVATINDPMKSFPGDNHAMYFDKEEAEMAAEKFQKSFVGYNVAVKVWPMKIIYFKELK